MTNEESKINSFTKIVKKLEEAIIKYNQKEEEKEFFRDSAIQRFEIAFDLSWKNLKNYLLDKKGLTCSSPKDCFRQSFESGIFVKDNPLWIEMTNDRNLMSHIYDEDEAEKVFKKLPQYLLLFKELLEELKK